MKAGNKQNLFQKQLWVFVIYFLNFFELLEWKNLNELE